MTRINNCHSEEPNIKQNLSSTFPQFYLFIDLDLDADFDLIHSYQYYVKTFNIYHTSVAYAGV